MTAIPCVFRRLSGMPDITRLEKRKTALILIEFQKEHFSGALPIASAEKIIEPAKKMMSWADKNKIKVFHIKHQAKSIASKIFSQNGEGIDFHETICPQKKHEIQTKYASSAFSGSLLHSTLQAQGIDTLLLAGMSTASVICATAHDAKLLGYKTIVCADVTASREVMSWDLTNVISEAKMQETALANISDKYAQVMLSQEIMRLPLAK